MSKHNIEQCVRESLENYFRDLDGSQPHDIYDMVISCAEKPMLEIVLANAGGNQSLASEYLGINRNTLRKAAAALACCKSRTLSATLVRSGQALLLHRHDQASAHFSFR